MRLLVLGGTRFVGRALVADALARGWDVTALHRGVTGALPAGVATLHADRSSEGEFRAALGDSTWDAVVDTWAGAPATAGIAARALAGRATAYGYVSSASVYVWGQHVDERSPVVDGDPDATDGDYAAVKRGSELAIQRSFPGAVLARAGLILGPHEDIGRLPWWLDRFRRGGQVVAPGRPGRPLQFIDARDLAAWLLTAVVDGVSGAVDVVGPSGIATTESFLATCARVTNSNAELVWVSEADIAAAGVEPWTQFPCWVPEVGEYEGFFETDTSLAAATGLAPRPVEETVADTWAWLRRDGMPSQRSDRDVYGLPEDLERRLLAGHWPQ
ncbi:MAG: hypothetical protein JWM93_3181 [Frankiales bacterium]|nr:hypothetical protein [Frankiales bacterium]